MPLGVMFGEVLEISNRTREPRDLSEAWMRIELRKGFRLHLSMVVACNRDDFNVGIRMVRAWDVLARVFQSAIPVEAVSSPSEVSASPDRAGREDRSWQNSPGPGGLINMI